MHIREFGNPAHPKVILLAPMMISGENLYHYCGYFAGNTAAYVTELEAFIK
jgi:hypothetical protein